VFAEVAHGLVAEHDGPTMFGRTGVMRALHRNQPKGGISTAPEAGQTLQDCVNCLTPNGALRCPDGLLLMYFYGDLLGAMA
jgi:hypothetical protein